MIDPNIATDLILHLLKRITDYDFTHYSLPVLQRRIDAFIKKHSLTGYSDLFVKLLEGDEGLAQKLIQSLTITYSMFFRDPEYFERLHFSVIPKISVHAKIKVWSLGCATGEEMYSLACLFKINQVLERTQLIGTDINEVALERARQGSYALERLDELEHQFKVMKLDRRYSLIDAIDVTDQSFSFNQKMRKQCQFTKHNIVSGGSLGLMHLVSCRNLLIYLHRDEQLRIIQDLLIPSVAPGGYLLLGSAESIDLEFELSNMKKVANGVNIYQIPQ
ncbi:CheR family methyltransferase [Aliiglaciecola litoralis]|uniref:Chemotaxis protein CheR n=1 Tax=Aliiglaciecola litoralis TaxID=582857 RepID=A0ABN1LE99_9ALTE